MSSRLHEIAAAGNLADLHWPNFTDYRLHFQHIYEASNFEPVWLNNGKPTPQALAVIQALEASLQKGLNPDDYDASRWPDRLHSLDGSPAPDTLAQFDAALTVGVMRYISDLHIGRVNPKHFNFGIDIEQNKYDLPQFVTTKVIHAANVQSVLDEVEPPYNGYKATEAMLQKYLQLAAQGDGPQVPDVTKTVAPGDPYAGVSQLTQRLRLFGDLHADTSIDTSSPTYSGSLVNGVKTFQSRHGLASDGKLGKETIRQLNTPLSRRVVQLQDALERWRWLPPQFPQPPIVANIPEFILRAFGPGQKVALAMNVVVGKAIRTQTPVFAKDMKYIVFRPYWNVPTSILRGEIIPGITRDRGYISKKNFEVTDFNGKVITDGPISDDVLTQLRAGKLTVRQKPGPTNSLGLVKFMFPNEYNVYLHSTPAQELFSQSRRDFSHGCVRVEKPAQLAAYLLRNQPPWTLEKVQAAMQSGPDNQQVNLTTPIPVLILYVTAVVEEDGSVHFFDDIYGYDKTLEAVLAKGQPYPG
ncbi:L,D-transpeptidase family protein [Alloacidobacterium sp.]|uniref:L,D-transpeptidase family protein n=1 Tax=Alloacidobacterium sp. TaxID=2951999 RepID=UPI002D5D4522|nr:L,D-transpeptidase family protein [Alloacidobacterium sp.]HYK34760.1 L,D-transpeptidase family protein [Alloacidobacterium sp.]